MPLLLPEPPEVMTIQLALLTPTQLHPLDGVTATLPVPPVESNAWLLGETEYVQLLACLTAQSKSL